MALPTVPDLKRYLRIETSAEDVVLAGLLAGAIGRVRALLDRPIAATSTTYVVEDRRATALNVSRLSAERQGATFLRIPDTPVAADPAVVITDANGDIVPAADYRLTPATGLLRAVNGLFDAFPYTIVATVGLETRDDYDEGVEPVLGAAIIDVAADLYHRRNPAATAERAGGGAGVEYSSDRPGIPGRVRDLLAPFARVAF